MTKEEQEKKERILKLLGLSISAIRSRIVKDYSCTYKRGIREKHTNHSWREYEHDGSMCIRIEILLKEI